MDEQDLSSRQNLAPRQLHARLSRQNHARLNRLWQLTEYLNESHRGLTVAQLLARVQVSRATIYRDIELLEHVGVGLHRETVNGEVRYRLGTNVSLQRAALMFARMMLTPVAESSLLAAFDSVVDGVSSHCHRPLPSTPPLRPVGHLRL